jgi:hypothetical protein
VPAGGPCHRLGDDLRDAAVLAKLPAHEQKAFTQLWADVAALLKKADEKP